MSAVATPAEPFLDESFHIRWSLLVPEEIESNISKALEISQKNIDDLANWDGESELTFENTLMALEKASESLDRGWGALSHLDSVRNSEAQREAYKQNVAGGYGVFITGHPQRRIVESSESVFSNG